MADFATTEIMRSLAEKAVIHARQTFSAKLDYTARSIKSVEAGLGMLHSFLASPENNWTASQIQSMTMLYGGYLGEVIKRQCGGEWQNSPMDRPLFEVAGVRCVPSDKILKRLRDGAEDNIFAYYESLALAIIPAAMGLPMPNAAEPSEPLNADFSRISHSIAAFSVLIPNTWKHYEKGNALSCHPTAGVSLFTLMGQAGWIPFENFVAISLKPFSEHTSLGTPRQIDGKNSIGRCYGFSKTIESKTTHSLVYCLQCPSYSIAANMLTVIPITEVAQRLFDFMTTSIEMRE